MTTRELTLLHGWGMNDGVWADLPALLDRWRLYPLALPGHGGAPFHPRRLGLADWADACLERAPARSVWLGWSLGGLVALMAALRAPERIAGLVLVTATPRFAAAADWPHAMATATLAQFHGELLAAPAATLERFLGLQVRGTDDARGTLRRLRAGIAERPPAEPAALAAGLELLAGGDLRARLGEIGVPALWLFGERDRLVPAAVAGDIAALMPAARIAVIPGAGHAPLISHGAAAAAQVDDFLDGLAR